MGSNPTLGRYFSTQVYLSQEQPTQRVRSQVAKIHETLFSIGYSTTNNISYKSYCQTDEKLTCIPLTHNSVQSHNSVHFLLFTCLTSCIKEFGSLHSSLAVKTEISGKTGF